MNSQKYKNYFTKQYKLKYNEKSVGLYRLWLNPQWKEVKKQIPETKNISVLEIGSGIGTFYSFLKESFKADYIGLELDRDAVDFTNKFYKTDSFKVKSLEDFNPSQKFDVVLAFEVLEHLEDPSTSISKISGLLKPGGKFLGTSPYPFKKNVLADSSHKYVLHPSGWKKLFIDNGFKAAATRPFSFLPYIWRFGKMFNPIIPIYVPLPYFISTTFIVAEK